MPKSSKTKLGKVTKAKMKAPTMKTSGKGGGKSTESKHFIKSK